MTIWSLTKWSLTMVFFWPRLRPWSTVVFDQFANTKKNGMRLIHMCRYIIYRYLSHRESTIMMIIVWSAGTSLSKKSNSTSCMYGTVCLRQRHSTSCLSKTIRWCKLTGHMSVSSSFVKPNRLLVTPWLRLVSTLRNSFRLLKRVWLANETFFRWVAS